MNILLTGATGLLGRQIGKELVQRGHTIIGITRNASHARLVAPYPATWVEGDLEKRPLALPPLLDIDGVIHLAGESIANGSWTTEHKQKILQSRSAGTQNLLSSLKQSPAFFISASAIGYYGQTETGHSAIETDPPGTGFLSEVTKEWERASEALSAKTRRCVFRLGVVFSTEGGALPEMLFPAEIFASSRLGSGEQWISWIHIDDAVAAFADAVDNKKFDGIFNLTAPEPLRQKELAEIIAQKLNALRGPPIPTLAMKLILGQQASLVLNSQNVSSQKLQNIGLTFRYANARLALDHLLKDWGAGYKVKKFEQYIDKPRDKVFSFFAGAENLEKITPDFLNFHVLHTSTPHIEENTLIDYQLNIHGFPVKWKTRISQWKANSQFTDIQLKGPYHTWEHTHSFSDLASGTLIRDEIRYKLPMGLLGRMVAQSFVDKDVDRIFSYRRKAIDKLL